MTQPASTVRSHRLRRAAACIAVASSMTVAIARPAATIAAPEAANAPWQRTGPQGGFAAGIVVDPRDSSTVYAAMFGGEVVKSTDAGQTWRPMSDGLPPAISPTVLAIDPVRPATLYVGDGNGQVYKTSGGGERWYGASAGLPFGAGQVECLVVAGGNPATLYLSLSRGSASGTVVPSGVFKSIDAGESWFSTDFPERFEFGSIDLSVDRANPDVVYAGANFRLYKTRDGGQTWQRSDTGLPSARINRIQIDPQTPDTVYLTLGNGVFRSNNAGASWQLAGVIGTTAPASTLAIDPITPSTLYVGATAPLFSSTERRGVFKSTDAGVTWMAGETGLPPQTSVAVLALDPSNPSALYAGTAGRGIFRSPDGADSWTPASSGLRNTVAFPVAADPVTSNLAYTGTSQQGILRTTDGGATWEPINTGLPTYDYDIADIAIDPIEPTTMYILLFGVNLGNSRVVWKTVDGGRNWLPASSGPPGPTGLNVARRLAIDPLTPTIVYVASSTPPRVHKTLNGGQTWALVSSGLPTGSSLLPNGLVVDPATPTTLYLGLSPSGTSTNPDVYKSTDGGATWSARANGLPTTGVPSLAIDSSNPDTLYAAALNAGVFKTQDAGRRWLAMNEGLPTAVRVLSVAVDPNSPTTVYASTSQHGVFVRTSAANAWISTGSGLPPRSTNSLAVDQTGAIYATVSGRGVFVRTWR